MTIVTLPLIQYWHDESVPEDVEALFTRMRETNTDMRQMIFNRASAKAFIETHFGLREATAFEACAVPAMQADFFRYCAVHALGGFYCDADCHCTGSLSPLLDADGFLVESMRMPEVLNNNLFAFREPGHPLPGLATEIATAAVENRVDAGISAVTGPLIFNLLWSGFKQGSFDGWPGQGERTPGLVRRKIGIARQLEAVGLAVGDYTRLADAFDGVRVLAWADILDVITPGSTQLAYKRTRDHFPNWTGSIYRRS